MTRADLLWRLMVFQLKLVMDGIRDIALVPVSLIAGVIGIVRGGPDADRPFEDVLRFGRRTEVWINLFGHQQGDTADKLIEPFQKKVFAELENNPQLKQVGVQIGSHLDKVRHQRGKPDERPADEPVKDDQR
jgi:hypothetical protein